MRNRNFFITITDFDSIETTYSYPDRFQTHEQVVQFAVQVYISQFPGRKLYKVESAICNETITDARPLIHRTTTIDIALSGIIINLVNEINKHTSLDSVGKTAEALDKAIRNIKEVMK